MNPNSDKKLNSNINQKFKQVRESLQLLSQRSNDSCFKEKVTRLQNENTELKNMLKQQQQRCSKIEEENKMYSAELESVANMVSQVMSSPVNCDI